MARLVIGSGQSISSRMGLLGRQQQQHQQQRQLPLQRVRQQFPQTIEHDAVKVSTAGHAEDTTSGSGGGSFEMMQQMDVIRIAGYSSNNNAPPSSSVSRLAASSRVGTCILEHAVVPEFLEPVIPPRSGGSIMAMEGGSGDETAVSGATGGDAMPVCMLTYADLAIPESDQRDVPDDGSCHSDHALLEELNNQSLHPSASYPRTTPAKQYLSADTDKQPPAPINVHVECGKDIRDESAESALPPSAEPAVIRHSISNNKILGTVSSGQVLRFK